MSGEIYIDVVFGANLLMDYVLLRVLGMLMGFRRNILRCLGAAFVGALFSCLVLCFGQSRVFAPPFGAISRLYSFRRGRCAARGAFRMALTAPFG